MRRLVTLAAFLTALTTGAPAAFAHGERNLEPIFRLRGITFLDVQFSDTALEVNDPLRISGKFRLMNSWPRTVPLPELAYLNVLVPGPRLAVTERRINGRFVQNAFHIEPGRLYDFEIGLRAREPGDWHLHALVNLQGTGSLVAPGKMVTIAESDRVPTFPVELAATGESIDLETIGTTRVIGWHSAFIVLGLAWCLFWVRRPLVARTLHLREGHDPALLFTRGEHRLAAGFAVVLVAMVATGVFANVARDMTTIPHQVQDDWDLPELAQPDRVETGQAKFRYAPIDRTMELTVVATNRADVPVRLHRFSTAYLTFLAEDALADWPVPVGSSPIMTVTPPGPIAPGESRELRLTMQDSIWEVDSFVNTQQPQVTAAGLLVFVDAGPPTPGEARPIVMTTTDREAPGVPWNRVVSVNEAFSDLSVEFSRGGS